MKRPVLQLVFVLTFLAFTVWGANHYEASVDRDHLRVWFFDVGQGDAVLFDTPSKQQVLIDGGPNEKIVSHLGRALPLSDKDLDLVVITHNHSDHLKGVNEVLRHYSVERVWISGAIHTTDTYLEFLELVKSKRIAIETVKAGQTTKYGDLEGVVIYPFQEQRGRMPDNQHDASVVSYWTYGNQSIMLTGDAETEHESEMLNRGVIRNATVLKVGHHGSKTSSSEAFLKRVGPQVAVIQVGKNNRYGHPAPTTIQRLMNHGIKVLRNDEHGTIRFSIWPDRLEYKTGL